MAKVKTSSSTGTTRSRRRPAISPESREQQMINAAMNLAEEQLSNGTASSQVITHFLKLGTAKARLEQAKLEKETELLKAKAESIESAKQRNELYEKAIAAMRRYSGHGDDEEEYDY